MRRHVNKLLGLCSRLGVYPYSHFATEQLALAYLMAASLHGFSKLLLSAPFPHASTTVISALSSCHCLQESL